MSFKSREKKRQTKLAINRSRTQHQEKMAGRHYLTIVSRHCSCNACGGSLREGGECVYRHTPREILCKEVRSGSSPPTPTLGAMGEAAEGTEAAAKNGEARRRRRRLLLRIGSVRHRDDPARSEPTEEASLS